MDDSELNEKDEEINSNHRSRRIQSIGGGSPLIKKSTSGRRKSQTKSVTIKTSTSSVPTPLLGRNDGVSSSSGNDIILHVGGSAWTRESLAYEAAMNDDGENSRPSSAHGGRNNSHRKSIDQSKDLSHTKTKVAGEYVQSISDQLYDGEKSDDFSHIKFVAEQQSDRKNVNVEIVEKAFKEYKSDINQSLSDLDTKINHLEGMIKLLVDRIPTVPHSDVKKSVGEKED